MAKKNIQNKTKKGIRESDRRDENKKNEERRNGEAKERVFNKEN